MKKLVLFLILLTSTLSYSQSLTDNGVTRPTKIRQALADSQLNATAAPVLVSPADATPESIVQKQVEAYNARDIDAFLATYADDVELYDLPDKLLAKGKEAMRKQYGAFFSQAKSLHCEIANRIVINNTVIDHEKVTVNPQKPPSQAVAIYKVENGLIRKVYFTQ